MGTLGSKIESLGITVVDLGINSPWALIIGYLRLLIHCSRFGPDILQGWMYHANLAVTLTAPWIKSNPRIIWGIRGSLHDKRSFKWSTRIIIRLCRYFSGKVDALIFNSDTGALNHASYGYRMEQSQVIPNGFSDTGFFCANEEKMAVREELGIDSSALVIGSVGRYHYAKGSDLLFSMLNILLDSMPQVKVICIGRGMDLQNPSISKFQWAKDAFLLGDRGDVPRLLCVMDVFVNASRTEGFPNALAEAMLAGLPCIASDVGDSRKILSNGGTVVQPGDVKALAVAAETLLSLDPESRKSIGQAGRNHILSQYSQARCTQAYLDLYDRVLDGQ